MASYFKPLRRKISVVTLVLACVFAVGWMRSVGVSHSETDTDRRQLNSSESIPVRPFEIQITLDEAAKSKLELAGESIIVVIYFDGDGTPQPGVKTAPFRDVYLGSHEFEIQSPGTFSVTDAKISKEAFQRLDDSNYHYSTSVFSGRRVFSNNLLDGGFTIGRVDDLSNSRPITVRCSLIRGS